MGHADIDETMQSVHFAPRAGDAYLVAEAFAPPAPVVHGSHGLRFGP
jgi:hypothetical protein